MNVVIIGICIWFQIKAIKYSGGMIKSKYYSYRHKEFKRFIEAQKKKFNNVELIPGSMGRWIEIKLEEDEIDHMSDDTIINRSISEENVKKNQ